jgi:iron complex outermembrane receptor protein
LALALAPWVAATAHAATFAVSGVVRDATGAAVSGATVTLAGAVSGAPAAETGADGAYDLALAAGAHTLVARRAGYEDATRRLDLSRDTAGVDFTLAPAHVYRLSETVVVQAIRADARTPVTKTDIGRAEIEARSHGQELPALLQETPGVTAYSEAGNASGYSYFYVRGIQQSRVNVTLDGVPLNDGEDGAVYFVDFADLQGSLDSIQVQRGVGASTVGAAAYAGSINLASVDFSGARRLDLGLGAGSFGSARANVALASGDLGGGISLYGRGVVRSTDGFRERSGVSQDALYFGAARRDERSLLRLFGFSGRERTQLAFYAADEDTLRRDLRANPLQAEEKDRFGEDFAQAQYTRFLGSSSSLGVQGYYVGAGGWYRLWDDPAARGTLYEYGLDWRLVGARASFEHVSGGLHLTLGAHANDFASRHTQGVVGGARRYSNRGFKSVAESFAKLGVDRGRAHLYADAQVRHARFRYRGDLDLGSVAWTFFNPKLGLRFDLTPALGAYGSVGRTTREPGRGDMLSGEDNATVFHDLRAVRPERVVDVEAGVELRRGALEVKANAYAMGFRDEIALTGELSQVGLPLRRNVERSFRRGLELEATWKPAPSLTLRHASNVSRNRIRAWTQFYDVYDEAGTWVDSVSRAHRDVPPLLTPAVTLNQSLAWKASARVDLSLSGRWVSRAHLDNTGDDALRTPSFFDLDAGLALDLGRFVKSGRPRLRVQVDNLLDSARIWPSGYSYLYFVRDVSGADTLGGAAYFYPQARRNVYVTLDLTW